jgi:hypothetical protein
MLLARGIGGATRLSTGCRIPDTRDVRKMHPHLTSRKSHKMSMMCLCAWMHVPLILWLLGRSTNGRKYEWCESEYWAGRFLSKFACLIQRKPAAQKCLSTMFSVLRAVGQAFKRNTQPRISDTKIHCKSHVLFVLRKSSKMRTMLVYCRMHTSLLSYIELSLFGWRIQMSQ